MLIVYSIISGIASNVISCVIWRFIAIKILPVRSSVRPSHLSPNGEMWVRTRALSWDA